MSAAVRRWNAQAREVFDELPSGVAYRWVSGFLVRVRDWGWGHLPSSVRALTSHGCLVIAASVPYARACVFSYWPLTLSQCSIGRPIGLVQLLITTPSI